ncbi:SMI1/KNR4 family protein [Embleya sp. NBC_00896]|uniref:SMI1/KNR4 family protein n=1 Tax=Embleya sp. NBC_00896 TaxID=2975961 RepID=UPI0038642526|nr:SMI1/KNR4 family protein [Embleya sp. NBC_00896]
MGDRVSDVDWGPFLRTWSAEWIEALEPAEAEVFPEEARAAGWLGFAPATEERIVALEERLGLRLPPSYRSFLAVSDGWRNVGEFIQSLGSTEQVGWFRDLSPQWCKTLIGIEDDAFHRGLYRRVLQISLEGDAAVLFLDPGRIDADGEWTAYFHASWTGDLPRKHADFAALMRNEYRSFHRLRKPDNATSRAIEDQVERARVACLAGAVDEPLAVFEEGSAFGRFRAELMRFQVHALLGNRDEARRAFGTITRGDQDDPAWRALIAGELVPVFGALHRDEPMSALRRSIFERELDELGERFGGEAEAAGEIAGEGSGTEGWRAAIAAARESAVAGDDAAAWRIVSAGLARWRPIGPDHVAPVALLADPVLGPLLTPERGRELLGVPRAGR